MDDFVYTVGIVAMIKISTFSKTAVNAANLSLSPRIERPLPPCHFH
jgi:hypothetical protein